MQLQFNKIWNKVKEPVSTLRKHDYNRVRTWYFNNTYKGTTKSAIQHVVVTDETKESVIIVLIKDHRTEQYIQIYVKISNTTVVIHVET